MIKPTWYEFYKWYFRFTTVIIFALLSFFILLHDQKADCDKYAEAALDYYDSNVKNMEFEIPEARMYHLNEYLKLSRRYYECEKENIG